MKILTSTTVLQFFMAAAVVLAMKREPVDGTRDEEHDDPVSFIQSHSSLKPGRLLADTNSLAQTAVRMAISHLTGTHQAASTEVRPLWESAQEFDDEHHSCARAGLSPGVCAISALARAAEHTQGPDELDFFNPERLERALFQELEAAVSGMHSTLTVDHLQKVEEELSDLYASLPKNADGFLDHATVKYATHQRFLRSHAWYVRSLNPVGEAQAPASPGEALRGQVPEHLQRLLEKRQEGRGLGLQELAALVATLDHLIQGDSSERLKAAFVAHGLNPEEMTPRLDIAEAIKTYVAHFLSLRHKSGYALTPEQSRRERRAIETGYPGWPEILRLVSQSMKKRAPDSLWTRMRFSEALEAANEVMEEYTAISAQDCLDIKKEISELPHGDTGKVLLRDLHQKALQESSLFAESTEYLSLVGALEGSPEGDASVLVPNYVYGPSNCLGTTSFFDMCCPNECESLLQRLERGLQAPSVQPDEVERTLGPLPANALAHLERLAASRGGAVRLHGYTFSLWLHNTFPSECPKPRHADFQGARNEEEVPDAGVEFQAVANLSVMAASTSDLKAELEANSSKVDLPADTRREDHPHREAPQAPQANSTGAKLWKNVSQAIADSEGGLHVGVLRALASEKLLGAGLKLSSGFDGASLAQTGVLAQTGAATPADESISSEDPDSARKFPSLSLRGHS